MYDQPSNDFASEWHTLASVDNCNFCLGSLYEQAAPNGGMATTSPKSPIIYPIFGSTTKSQRIPETGTHFVSRRSRQTTPWGALLFAYRLTRLENLGAKFFYLRERLLQACPSGGEQDQLVK